MKKILLSLLTSTFFTWAQAQNAKPSDLLFEPQPKPPAQGPALTQSLTEPQQASPLTQDLRGSFDHSQHHAPMNAWQDRLASLARQQPIGPQELYLDTFIDFKVGQKHALFTALKNYFNLDDTTPLYSQALEQIVKQKQAENGLHPNGIIDRTTLFSLYPQTAQWQQKALDKTLKDYQRIEAIVQSQKPSQFIVVHVPQAKLELFTLTDNGYQSSFESKVIVGTPKTQTPLEDFFIWGIKFNPTWSPTNNIIGRTILKNGQFNADYVQSHQMKIYTPEGQSLDISEAQEHENPASLRFVQPASQSNALGVLKFETTSGQSIYLHDTNERKKFTHNQRFYSSGCVRVDQYLSLATRISQQSEEKITDKINQKKTLIEKLPVKVPVYFAYSLFDPATEQFFPDIYSKLPK